MGSDVITIDFSGMLDEEQMAEIEAKANQIIWENQKVEIFYPTEEELKNLDYRSKKELSGWVLCPPGGRGTWGRGGGNGEAAFCGEIP